MNLTANHCKLLQKVWRDLRQDKLHQIERPVLWSISYCQPEKALVCASSSSMGVVCVWNDPVQQDLYQIVLSFVDNAIAELKSRHFRQRLGEHCRRFGRHMAMVFRGTNSDVDQTLSWEMLGQAIVENLTANSTLRGSTATARLFVWQLFLENLSAYEEKNPLYKRLIAKFSRKPIADSKDKQQRSNCTRTVATQPTMPLAVEASSAPALFVPRNAETYRALYPYKPEHSDELALLEDDIVFVVEKCDDGWFIGKLLRTGQFGTFPGNYVVKH
uniref:SH3 domain-containing protein n=1 Tax=Ditylenchus dipsaci TaxID=166011 RepID=A0A915D0U5_9BILA